MSNLTTFSLIALGAILITAGIFLSQQPKLEVAKTGELERAFIDFMQRFGKQYSPEEEVYRFGIFASNYYFVQAFNAEQKNVTLGINLFSDLAQEEWASLYMGRRDSKKNNTKKNYKWLDTTNLPDSVNWLAAGAVTPIKNQGQCGSCWAFSTVGSSEGAHFLKTSILYSMSEQQIVDCSTANDGCDGGNLDPAFEYVIANGMVNETTYPYAAVDQSCQFNPTTNASEIVFTPTAYTNVPEDDSNQLAAALVNQPISVCIEANRNVFQLYSTGILSSKMCGTQLDHCVTLIGYNTTAAGASGDYWIVKNSWGTTWGQNGYIWIEKSTSAGKGVCGIAEEPAYPAI